MSCYNGKCYLPQPPRAWSRVQNTFSLITDTTNYSVNSQNAFTEKMNMLQKGNVLQYKNNSGNLTQKQRYSLIAQGKWVNRNTTWATQSTRGYTNPNNTSLKRVGGINVEYDPITLLPIGVTTVKPSCLKPTIIDNNILPSDSGGSSLNPEVLPPPPPPKPDTGGTNLPYIPIPLPVSPIIIPDEGSLLCNVKENVCTGETITTIPQQLCNPTTDSDVPGSIQSLCWNDGTPTWYPRQRYVMTNSDNKWPVNATLVSAVNPRPPDITSITSITSINAFCEDIITLTWTQVTSCIPITRYTIFQNDIPIQLVGGNIFSAEIAAFNSSVYNYYIVSGNGNVESEPSNIVSISIVINLEPLILDTCVSNAPTEITITWSKPVNMCCSITQYTIYYLYGNITKSILIDSSQLQYTITGLSNGTTYTCSISYLCGINESPISNSLTATTIAPIIPLFIATGLYTEYSNNGYSAIVFPASSVQMQTIIFNYNLQVHLLVVGGGGGGGLQNGYNSNPPNAWNGGGGGGGGIYYDALFNATNQVYYTILVGNGGNGAPTGPLANPTCNGTAGGNTIITWNTNAIIANGGIGSDGANGTDQIQVSSTYNSLPNINCKGGGYGGNANGAINPNSWTNGFDSELISILLPFTALPTTIFLSGGGGGGTLNDNTRVQIPNQFNPIVENQYGGESGHGYGGIGQGEYAPISNGQTANGSIPDGGFGGGGGGGIGTMVDWFYSQNWPHFYGGDGGDGVVIMWWANL